MIGAPRLQATGEPISLDDTLARMDTWTDDYNPSPMHQMCRALRDGMAAEKRRADLWRELWYGLARLPRVSEILAGHRARRALASLKREMREAGLVQIVGLPGRNEAATFLMLSSPDPLLGERVLFDETPLDDGSYHAFVLRGASPRRSIGCFKMVEPE